jgi:hypothetical protein
MTCGLCVGLEAVLVRRTFQVAYCLSVDVREPPKPLLFGEIVSSMILIPASVLVAASLAALRTTSRPVEV